jgi:uncharacterized protein
MPSAKSVRTCVSCGAEDDPRSLVKWVRGPDGEVIPDLRGKLGGRGAWAHARPECMKKIQAGLSRSFRASVTTSTTEAASRLGQAAENRVEQLLLTLRRRNLGAVGGSFAAEAYRSGRGHGVLVATDAQAAAHEGWVQEAVREGRAMAWGNKDRLGAFFGRDEVAVITILEERLAKDIFGAIAMALLAPKLGPRGKTEHQPSQGSATEVE